MLDDEFIMKSIFVFGKLDGSFGFGKIYLENF